MMERNCLFSPILNKVLKYSKLWKLQVIGTFEAPHLLMSLILYVKSYSFVDYTCITDVMECVTLKWGICAAI